MPLLLRRKDCPEGELEAAAGRGAVSGLKIWVQILNLKLENFSFPREINWETFAWAILSYFILPNSSAWHWNYEFRRS